MYAKSSLVALCGMLSIALGSVVVRPDDPYAFLAAEATSYEDLANRVAAYVAASGETPAPAPSPIVTPAQQQEIDDLVKNMQPVERRNGALAARQGRVSCGGITAFAPDMVRCVNYLASLGQQECRIPYDYRSAQMCSDKSAHIIATSGAGERATAWYVLSFLPLVLQLANVAKEAGHIMDLCTQGNQQVGGQGFLDSDGFFNVILSGAELHHN
ncbi:hypothetical protein PG984_003111 [Apiospora sp. TS-2023a]